MIERFVDRIRAGKGGLVVGAGFGGLLRWPEGSLASAARAGKLDPAMWQSPEVLPDAIKLLGRVPVRAVWTTHPGDLVWRAVHEGSPPGWPDAVAVPLDGTVDARKRHVLRLLYDSQVGPLLTPEAVRRSLARVRPPIGELYREGSLILVGYGKDDPDLELLLDRIFGGLEPPAREAEHLLVGGASGRAEALMAEHRIARVDDGFLEELVAACEKAGISLARARPDADDLEGWNARLAEDASDAEAQAALEAMERRAREGGRPERLVEILLARVEHEPTPPRRAQALRELARVYEVDIGDKPRAFTALATALKEQPGDEELIAEAERLAAETDGWAELVADLSEIVGHIDDRRVAASHWVRLGRWYQEKLRHDDYAVASYREAIKLDADRRDARAGLADLYRRQQRWSELAEELSAHAALEGDPRARAGVLHALGELHETALAAPGRAVDAYEKAAALDPGADDHLVALERLHRRAEAWGKLVGVLERRAALAEGGEDPARAAPLRKELAQLRSEKLGDVEGAIERWRAAVEANPRDLEALRALAQLYERTGDGEAHRETLEKLAEAGPDGERAVILRRLAAEVEDREGGAARAIRWYERVAALEPGAADVQRALERLYRAEHRWEALVALMERQILTAPTVAVRADHYAGLGKLHEQDLADPHRAVDAYAQAVELWPDHREALAALARLYRRIESWDRAVAVLERQAELAGAPAAADLWFESAQLLGGKLGDDAGAEARLARALEADPAHLPSLLASAERARRRGDFARAVAAMLDAERASGNRLERVGLLHDAAIIADEKLGAREQAVELLGRLLVLEPEHVEGGRRLADHLVAAGDWVAAEPVLEMLARKAEDKMERARRETQLGDAASALARLDKAARHYAQALEADPGSLPAALGLAEVHVGRHEHELADRALRQVLERHRAALAQGQVIDIWHKIGLGARSLGNNAGAEAAFRNALELDPGHRPSLREIVELSAARGDWKAAVQAKRDALEGAGEEERLRLLEEIGDLTAQRLGEPLAALGVYLEALLMRPRSATLLHKVLGIYTETHEWRRAVEIIDRLAEIEREPAVRAKLHYTGALIARDELAAPDEAVTRMGRALDDAPSMDKAFEAIERVLGERQDWKGLVRAYTQMIKRLGDGATAAQQLYLWTRLADIASEKLGDRPAAMAAYEVAAALEPNNVGRHEQLADLYLAAGASHVDKAAAELQLLLRRAPDRLELYHKLYGLYASSGQRDKAYCLAQALALLGQASAEEKALAASLEPRAPVQARRRLTEELWQKAILHPREDRLMNGIFGLLMSSLAATTAQPHGALALNPREQAGADDPRPMARIFRYVVQVLGIQPPPELYLRAARGPAEGIQAANVAEKGVLTPAVLIHTRDEARGESEISFEVGKKLAYFRPERYVYYALATLPKLEAAFSAALVASGVSNGVKESDVEKLVAHVKRTVPASVLEHVAALARKHPAAGAAESSVAQAVSGWVTATDLTANRVGLILANDLETAARVVATEKGVATTLSAKERLRDLLAFSASEEYFAVRRHLGLEVAQ